MLYYYSALSNFHKSKIVGDKRLEEEGRKEKIYRLFRMNLYINYTSLEVSVILELNKFSAMLSGAA